MTGRWMIIPYAPVHARNIIENNLRECEGWFREAEKEGADRMIESYTGPWAYTLIVDDDPIACAGVLVDGWGVGTAWALLSTKAKSHKVKLFRAIKLGLEACIEDRGLCRVQCLVDPNHAEAIEYIECFGFLQEGLMRKSGPNGMDFFMYARVA